MSNLPSVVNSATKYEYATMSRDHWRVDGAMYFLPRSGQYLAAGFVSAQVADAAGNFQGNPKVTIFGRQPWSTTVCVLIFPATQPMV